MHNSFDIEQALGQGEGGDGGKEGPDTTTHGIQDNQRAEQRIRLHWKGKVLHACLCVICMPAVHSMVESPDCREGSNTPD